VQSTPTTLGQIKEVRHEANLAERKQQLQQYARNTLNKTRNINIRLSERDLYRLKAKAIEEGIPYQALASSILHKAMGKQLMISQSVGLPRVTMVLVIREASIARSLSISRPSYFF
jgi:predicted DNA binding CopG/RHH family protein